VKPIIFLAPTAILIVVLLAQGKSMPIGEIEFFGSAGYKIDRIRAALPIHERDNIPEESMEAKLALLRGAIEELAGHAATDVSVVCCDAHGQWMIYIGLGGRNSNEVPHNPVPTGSVRLPESIVKLYREKMDALGNAVQNGSATEDDSKGYAVMADPKLRAKQLEGRDYAVGHETLLRQVLETSSEAQQRLIAADLLGYANQSKEQIAALVRASRDADEGVRNNAARALMVLARVKAPGIPAENFIEMLSSGSWSDRNKSGFLLLELTRGRDPELLAAIRADALDALIEMAQWRNSGHAEAARMILGRIAGIEEKRLQTLSDKGQVDVIVRAIQRQP
jgi:hypothetical protein